MSQTQLFLYDSTEVYLAGEADSIHIISAKKRETIF
jgi:hypothetical protein